MILTAWLKRKRQRLLGTKRLRRSGPAGKAPRPRLTLEPLEDRTLLSITVRPLVGATDTLGVRSLAQVTNDLVYSAYDGMIYASVPSSAGAGGNSLKEIDPSTGSVVASFFVGSEPGKLAASDDGQAIYVGLMGAPSVVRFDVPRQAVAQTFALGTGSFGPLFAEDLAVVPGHPNAVAVSRRFANVSPRHGGVAVYVDGAKLAGETPGHTGSNSLAYSFMTSRLYGYDNETTEFGFRRLNVDLGSGVTTQDATGGLIGGFNVTIKYDAGTALVYSTNGSAVDPEAAGGPQLIGTYAGVGFAGAVLPDSGTGRTYFVSGNQLRVYDQGRFTLAETFTLPASGGSLIRWGDGQLAYRGNGQVYLLTLTPDPSALATNDLVYDPYDGMIYASVPGSAGAAGNSLAEINPATGRVVGSVFVGSEPGKLAASDDGTEIYVGLTGAPSVTRFNVPNQAVDLRFSLGGGAFGPMFAEDIEVAPGDPSTVAIARQFHGVSPRQAGVAIYTDGVKLPGETGGSNSIAFGATAGRLYGYNNESTEFGFRRMNVDPATGVTTQDTTGGLVGGFNVTVKYDPGTALVYSTNGSAVDPEADGGPRLVGTYTGVGFAASVLPDSATGRTYFINGNQLLVYNQSTFTPVETDTLPASGGSLVRWGDGLLAYRSGSQVFLLTLS